MLRPGIPEAELLFEIVQSVGCSNEEHAAIYELISEGLNWSEVFDLAGRHGMLSQLQGVCERTEADLPEGVEEQLSRWFRENTVNNLQYAQRLHSLMATFEKQGVRAIPYKGPTLAEYAYGGLNARWFVDLDLLIAEDDILRARDILLDMGFDQTNALGIDPTTLVKSSIFRWEHEFRFVRDDTKIELRYRFTGGEPADADVFEDLWKNRVPVSVAGRNVQALSPEDRILLLLRHGTKHGWLRLSWVYDAAAAIQQGVQWDQVLARAERYGWLTAILLGIAVTAELSNVEVPRRIRRAIADNVRANWGSSTLTTLFRSDPTGKSHDLDPLTVVLFLNDGTKRSVEEFVSVLLSPSIATHDMLPLPPIFYPVYYFLRPVELGQKIIHWT